MSTLTFRRFKEFVVLDTRLRQFYGTWDNALWVVLIVCGSNFPPTHSSLSLPSFLLPPPLPYCLSSSYLLSLLSLSFSFPFPLLLCPLLPSQWQLSLPSSFPDKTVQRAYHSPELDNSREGFDWGNLTWDVLTKYPPPHSRLFHAKKTPTC